MRIDPKSPVPIFKQIAEQIRQNIRRGVNQPGEMLPSLRALAIEIRVNPNTIQRAYELLEREGVVESRRGVGMFVCHHSPKKTNAKEERLFQRFESAVSTGLKQGISAERLRTLFENALHQQFQQVEK